MSERCNDIKIYRKLKPYTSSFFIVVFLYFIFLLVISIMCIVLIIDFFSQKDYGGIIFAFSTLALSDFFIIRNFVKNVKHDIAVANQRKRVRNSLSYNQWSELEKEINSSERFCGTIYFLDKFVYVPRISIMIEYENIREITIVTHYTDDLKDAVKIIITDNNSLDYSVWILNWKKFLKNQSLFCEKISKGNIIDFKEKTEKSSV